MSKQQNHITHYLEKRSLHNGLIAAPPAASLALIVTIPCYNESNLLDTLSSLKQCELPFQKSVEVIVVINSSIDARADIKQRNRCTFQSAQDWSNRYSDSTLRFHILYHSDLPKKHAGVGLARKIAMDEAVQRFQLIDEPTGIVVCLDADSLVSQNYFQAIHTFFQKHPNCPAANIHYEHPLEGDAYSQEVYDAILDYELHLRYYVHALQKAGLKNATQTVGSAMAVRAIDYAKQGGMNRRKAGEDFYFLHKFTAHKDFGMITDTTVLPSPRISTEFHLEQAKQ
ncbi:MAG: glycosyltransferase family 2 protein [Bacteroidota bacterium]